MTKLEFLESLLEDIEEIDTVQDIKNYLQERIDEAQEEEELAIDDTDEEEDSY
jgi:hypothetical protein